MKAVMYHYVRKRDDAFKHFRFLHINDFVRQLDYFTSTYSILHPDHVMEAIHTQSPVNGVLLTFDDGLKDHYNYVFPELVKRGLSALFYVSTGVYTHRLLLDVHIAHLLLGKFPGEMVYHQLMQNITPEMICEDRTAIFEKKIYRNHQDQDYVIRTKKIINYFMKPEFRTAVLEKLINDMLPGQYEQLRNEHYLSPGEMLEMKAAGMVFGSHTVTHPLLSSVDSALQVAEIRDSFNYLDQAGLSGNYRNFCYPYGGIDSFNKDTLEHLQDNNCAFAFCVDHRDIISDDLMQNRLALPRYDCNLFPFGQVYTM